MPFSESADSWALPRLAFLHFWRRILAGSIGLKRPRLAGRRHVEADAQALRIQLLVGQAELRSGAGFAQKGERVTIRRPARGVPRLHAPRYPNRSHALALRLGPGKSPLDRRARRPGGSRRLATRHGWCATGCDRPAQIEKRNGLCSFLPVLHLSTRQPASSIGVQTSRPWKLSSPGFVPRRSGRTLKSAPTINGA